MAITKTDLTSYGSDVDATSFVTSSTYTPGANRLVIAAVVNTKSTTADTPSFSGNGLTWVQITTVTYGTGDRQRVTLFRAMGASPSNGAGTADFAGVTQTGGMIHVFEFDGVDTGGTNGSAAVVQSATNTGAAVASLTVTLAAFGSSNNGAASAFSARANTAINPDTGWTEIYDIGFTTPVARLESQWRADNDTTAVGTMSSGTADMGGLALEIKAAAAGGSIVPLLMAQYRQRKN